MREYDDDNNIRLYTPVLQRIIILVAVIIAVPVVMWTITAFVRTYVAPPRVPTFQPLSLTPSPPPDSASAGQQAAVTPAPQDAQRPATPASPPTDANAPGAAAQVAAADQSAQPPQSTTAPPPDNAQPMPAAPATPDSANQAAAAPPPSNFAWPSPTTSPPAIPPGTMAAAPSGQDQATSDGASADLPTVAPLTGRIPLPRHRPNVIAMAEPAAPSTVTASALPMSAAVPLPRARPASAPEATPTTATDTAPVGGGMDAGHY